MAGVRHHDPEPAGPGLGLDLRAFSQRCRPVPDCSALDGWALSVAWNASVSWWESAA
ncbi:hypothetical protein [Nocardia sp. bgisy118]|uniref:hypothetical protein n=1 Tax=Nocardia sp. bgisy118 TaxID=3413786 RepID=UPI003F49CF4F